ncbi:MAG: head GIN domain-containing protein [Bacteroidota bacterium]
MKNQNFFFLPLCLVLLAITSCVVDDDGLFQDCERGDGPVVEEVLNLSNFTGIDLKINANVYITQDNFFEVVAKGEQNVIDELELDVRNDTWDIEFDDCMKDYELDIYITMPFVEFLAISGSGEIRGETFIDPEDLTLRISGSGEMCLGVFVEELDARITGSGDMELEGTAEEFDLKITGSGDVDAFKLICEEADVDITGSGDASVHVLEFLKVRISGSGDVFYKGFPELDISISGSGDVNDAN